MTRSGRLSTDAFAGSVVGARHRRLGEPREDAAGWSRSGTPAVLTATVADGHGDPRCTRSCDGARFAVGCAPDAAAEWWTDPAAEPHRASLAARLVARWRAAVDQDLARRPAEPAERGADDAVAAAPRLLYGTTVILATASDADVTVLRIGDGDAIGVNHDGVAYRLLEPDRSAVPGETSSLSAADADRLARSTTMARSEAPALIVLVTDGVTDAYSDDDGLLGACRELHEVWRDGGRERAEESVAAWLQAAAEYSGDDASAVAVRLWPEP
jgi:serine/threonine protein phosphatase PrpC